jgi:hypothetical protein
MQDLYRRETLNSRARNLAVFQPFFSLEAFKNQRGGKANVDLGPYDLQRLGMVVLDKVILEMGNLSHGATYAQILEATKPMLFAANPACTDRIADVVTTIVVEHLCNEQQRTVFVIRYQFEKEDGMIEWLENRFKILDPHESPDGDTIYDASTQAVNFFLASLDADLEAEQAARDAAYKHYMKRERFEDAAIMAEEQRKLTIQYRTKLRRALSALERNIFEVDYVGAVMPTIAAAREHMEERLRIDGEHIADVEHRLDSALGDASRHLANMREIFRNAKAHNVGLFSDVMGAHTKFRVEQARQKLRPQSPQAIFDPHNDALIPALKLPGGSVLDWMLENTHLFLPLKLAKPPDFADLVNEHLLQQPAPPPVQEDTDSEQGEPQPSHARFSEAEIEAAAALLEMMPPEFTLGGMLARGRSSGMSENSLLHAALKTIQWFGEDGDVRAWPGDSPLSDPLFTGDDLNLLRRPP